MPHLLVDLLAKRFAAMGHPDRLQILHALLEDGEKTVSEIGAEIHLSQSTASKHLGTLAGAGLVERRRDGTHACYRVCDPGLAAVCEHLCARVRTEVEAMGEAINGRP